MQLESTIQTAIRNQLIARGYMVTKIALASQRGWPDLLALKNGRTIFIEVKRPGKEPTPLQKLKHTELRRQGFAVYVLTSVNQLETIDGL
jgi:Holliday junction resolvase